MTVFANIFQPLIDVFEAVLTFFHDSVGLQWGVSIIALTVVVRDRGGATAPPEGEPS